MLYMHKMPSDILHTQLTHFIFGMVSQLFSLFLSFLVVCHFHVSECIVFIFSFGFSAPRTESHFILFAFDVSLAKCSLLFIIYSRQIGLIIVGKSRRCRSCISYFIFLLFSFPSLYHCFSFELWFFFILFVFFIWFQCFSYLLKWRIQRTEQRNVSFTFNRKAMSWVLNHIWKNVWNTSAESIDRLCGTTVTAMQPIHK